MTLFFSLNILFLFKIIYSSYISIPFEVQNFKNEKNTKIINNYIYKDILVKFLVGNPPQKVQLSACLGEFTTFIISKDARGFEGGTYNKNLSDTYSSLSESQYYIFQTFSEGITSKENFIIEQSNNEINGLEFMLVNDVVENNCYSFYCEVLIQPGILGFLLAQQRFFDENVTNINFIPQLKKKNLISNYDFNFHFISENSGNIIIGEKPHEYNNSHYKEENYIRISTSLIGNDLDWSLSFDNIYFGEEVLGNNNPILFRIEFGFIMGSYTWDNFLKKEFFNKLIEEKKCFRDYFHDLGSTSHFYYCNKTTDISKFKPFIFCINQYNYNFTLTYKDLFIEVEDKYLFLMLIGGLSEIIFGYPFLKKYQLIFNQDTKTIGFYTDISSNISSNISINISSDIRKDKENPAGSNLMYYIAISILGLILISLITIAIVCYVKRKKNNKKNASELSNEQYEENLNKNKGILIDDDFKFN